MTVRSAGARFFLLGALVALSAPTTFDAADATPQPKQPQARSAPTSALLKGNARAMQVGMKQAQQSRVARSSRFVTRGGGLQCVPFARENSGIELTGNAATWWYNADGVYERGSRPEVGSVLNFRPTGRMRLGHVAVVTNVLNSRTIEIDHANWASAGRISRNISVVDVSDSNDWSAVRVELSKDDTYGGIYPTFGFIYDRPDRGTMVANTAPSLSLNPAMRDHRPAAERDLVAAYTTQYDEVAEAPDDLPRAARRTGRTAPRSLAKVSARPVAYKATRATVHQVSAKQAPARTRAATARSYR